MTEAQLQDGVIDTARLLGWRVYHTFDSRRSQAGFPDLVLVRGPRLIFAELKSAGGRVRREQAEWLDALHEVAAIVEQPHDVGEVGVQVFVWRPDDWLSGAIESTLR